MWYETANVMSMTDILAQSCVPLPFGTGRGSTLKSNSSNKPINADNMAVLNAWPAGGQQVARGSPGQQLGRKKPDFRPNGSRTAAIAIITAKVVPMLSKALR